MYVEQKLEIEREFYLAALVNRDRGQVAVMASAAGGVDIEQVPHERIVRVDVDPLIGLANFQVQQLRRALGLEGEVARQFQALVRRGRRDPDRRGRRAGRDQSADRDRATAGWSPATPRCCSTTTPCRAIRRAPVRSPGRPTAPSCSAAANST